MAGKKAGSGKSINKTQIIREALAKGIISPSEVAAYVKQAKGLDIDPKYVSVIKSQLKGKEGLRAAKVAMTQDTQKEAMLFALRSGSIEKAKKSLEAARNDPSLAFAVSMGGIEGAISALNSVASQVGTGS